MVLARTSYISWRKAQDLVFLPMPSVSWTIKHETSKFVLHKCLNYTNLARHMQSITVHLVTVKMRD